TKNASNFLAGDVVVLVDNGVKVYNKVVSVDGNILTLALPFEPTVVDTGLIPDRVLYTCEVNIEVSCDKQIESFEMCSFNENSPNFLTQKLGKSDIVFADAKIQSEIINPFTLISGKEDGTHSIDLYGGFNGTQSALSVADYIGVDEGPNERTGIQSFIDNTEVSIMAIPGITDPQVQLNLVAHCELMTNRFAILDVPRDKKAVDDVMGHRNFFDSEFAAMYHPWVKISDPLTKNLLAIPPTGSIAGIYARTDTTRGVHKAPANEVVNACIALDCNYTTGEQDVLNPKGVNLIRNLPGQGIRVWGARTVSSNALWRYVNVRRLFIFIEESIRTSTNWVVFEPNDQLLWLRVRRTIEIFLGNVWRTGALAGTTEDEAFFVNIGPNTMTEGDIDAGRLICVIGIAPTKPAEFVIFRITQKTSDGGAE
ncbi:MAG: phage tail sheath subtilisin-like domain-containing protein, partial [Bacillota bacterium]